MNVLVALMLAIALLMMPAFMPDLVTSAFPVASEFPAFITRALLALCAVGVFMALIGRAT